MTEYEALELVKSLIDQMYKYAKGNGSATHISGHFSQTYITCLGKYAKVTKSISRVYHALPVPCTKSYSREYVALCLAQTQEGTILKHFHDVGKCPYLIYGKKEPYDSKK